MRVETVRGEQGSMIPLVGALVFVAFAVLALVVDIALLHGAYLDTAARADAAVEYGASMVDEGAIHDGVLRLDAGRASDATLSAIGPEQTVADLDVTADAVCVTVGTAHRTHAMTFIGIRQVDVRVRSCASPAQG